MEFMKILILQLNVVHGCGGERESLLLKGQVSWWEGVIGSQGFVYSAFFFFEKGGGINAYFVVVLHLNISSFSDFSSIFLNPFYLQYNLRIRRVNMFLLNFWWLFIYLSHKLLTYAVVIVPFKSILCMISNLSFTTHIYVLILLCFTSVEIPS